MESPKINMMATTLESEIDLAKVQRACPEIGHYFNYIEEKIRPVNPKWDRRVIMIIEIITSETAYSGT